MHNYGDNFLNNNIDKSIEYACILEKQ